MKKAYSIYFLIILITISAACSANNSTSQDPHPNMSHEENVLFATPDNPVSSPSGNYVLTVESGFNDNVYNNHFVVYEAGDNAPLVFASDKEYRTRDRLYFLWDENDNIWVYSGDIGITLWQKEDNIWVEQYPAKSDMPLILQEALD
jgi:hypothetical protein